MKIRLSKLKITLIVLILGVFIFLGIKGGLLFLDNKFSNFENECVLLVYPETPDSEVFTMIAESANPKYLSSLKRAFKKEDVANRLKPGRYIIKPEHTSIFVARMLVAGWQTPGNLTLSGTIRTKEAIAQKISRCMMVDSVQVMSAITNNEFLSKYGVDTLSLFSIILPDTYEMYWTDSVEQIFDRLKIEHDKFWTQSRKDRANEMGYTPFEITVLASIVRGESLVAAEYPMIAGAYLNRLRIGMKLQADPTIAFIHGYKINRILRVHLKKESPFNTYKYLGLPPAPINSPSKVCIDAVLNHAKHNYIYFCANPNFDGTHLFASSYSQHLRNARKFHKALNARLKEQKK